VQITRVPRKDGSTTFGLRVRIAGADERFPLGNSEEGWDEIRAETARRQLLAKIELGLWAPEPENVPGGRREEEPTFRELATDWLQSRKRNPAISKRTTELNESQLKRYLLIDSLANVRSRWPVRGSRSGLAVSAAWRICSFSMWIRSR
jgi:hypothetical protein